MRKCGCGCSHCCQKNKVESEKIGTNDYGHRYKFIQSVCKICHRGTGDTFLGFID